MSALRRTYLKDGTRISTIFRDDPTLLMMDSLLDPLFDRDPDKPFETMVFPKGSSDEDICVRYGTRQEAFDGHEKLVAEWAEKRSSPVDRDETFGAKAPSTYLN